LPPPPCQDGDGSGDSSSSSEGESDSDAEAEGDAKPKDGDAAGALPAADGAPPGEGGDGKAPAAKKKKKKGGGLREGFVAYDDDFIDDSEIVMYKGAKKAKAKHRGFFVSTVRGRGPRAGGSWGAGGARARAAAWRVRGADGVGGRWWQTAQRDSQSGAPFGARRSLVKRPPPPAAPRAASSLRAVTT
jgi:hypothetical protein